MEQTMNENNQTLDLMPVICIKQDELKATVVGYAYYINRASLAIDANGVAFVDVYDFAKNLFARLDLSCFSSVLFPVNMLETAEITTEEAAAESDTEVKAE